MRSPFLVSIAFPVARLGDMTDILLFKEYDGTEQRLEIPLTSHVDLEEIRAELRIPEFVDTSSFAMEKALVGIWAATNANRLHEIFASIVPKKVCPDPIPVLFFGGAAIRMHSPTSNREGSPFFRTLNDIDFIAPSKRMAELVRLLTKLGDMCGTRYHHFLGESDRRFNAMRRGRRYMIRTIDRISETGEPTVGILDILADQIDLRHRLDVRQDFRDPSENMYTISLENILLSKLQFIFDLEKSLMPQISDAGMSYRVLDYPFFKPDRIILGMELKDIKDVCAILADNLVGSEPRSISLDKINRVLRNDEKYALTCRLNLQNLVQNSQILDGLNIGRSTVSRIIEGVEAILNRLPVVDKKWSNPWWNQDVETPQIFGKAPP